jgi:DNA-binding winged helix-turn-helix (wHTH) protein
MEQLHQSGAPSGRRYRIGKHVYFDAQHRCLWHINSAEGRFVLEPLPAATLLKLIHQPRTVVHWEQLLDPGQIITGVTPDPNDVARAVLALRKAFLYVDPDKAYVRVLPRLGYVLIADVVAESDEPDEGTGV